MRERDGVDERVVEPRVGQRGLEPALDGFLDLDRQRSREGLGDVRQAVLDTRLDTDPVDHLDTDPVAASGSMTAGSSMTVPTSAEKRSVLKATWCVQMARVVTRIARQARSRAMPARIRRPRRGRGGAGVASVAVDQRRSCPAHPLQSTRDGAPKPSRRRTARSVRRPIQTPDSATIRPEAAAARRAS